MAKLGLSKRDNITGSINCISHFFYFQWTFEKKRHRSTVRIKKNIGKGWNVQIGFLTILKLWTKYDFLKKRSNKKKNDYI